MASSPCPFSRVSISSDSDPHNSLSRTPAHQDAATANAVDEVLEKKPAKIDSSENMSSKEHIENFKKYEADYTRYLKAKYFSSKDIYGGNVFEEKATIDGMTIKASRWPGTGSYADPVSFRDESSSSSSSDSGAETPTKVSNGKHSSKKGGGSRPVIYTMDP